MPLQLNRGQPFNFFFDCAPCRSRVLAHSTVSTALLRRQLAAAGPSCLIGAPTLSFDLLLLGGADRPA